MHLQNDPSDQVPEIKTLSKAEAAVVKAANPPLNPWRVVAWQLVATIVLGAIGLLLMRDLSLVYSLVWGGLCVVVPAAIFARGLMSRFVLMNAGSATAGFFLWELVKIACTVAMLLSASQVLRNMGQNLSWPAMLVGLVVVMKVYWLALLMKPRVR